MHFPCLVFFDPSSQLAETLVQNRRLKLCLRIRITRASIVLDLAFGIIVPKHAKRKTAETNLVRPSRDGDQFHYHWAARRCLNLLLPGTELKAVTIEGASPSEKTPSGPITLQLRQVLQERPELKVETGGKAESVRDGGKLLEARELIEDHQHSAPRCRGAI
jgi:hypothetical protein